MKLNKKTLGIMALILTLAATNVTLAVFYINRDVAISGGVATQGSIQLYGANGETAMTTLDFPDFTAESSNTYSQTFFVNNTGNVPVVVYWTVSNTIPTGWTIHESNNYYIFTEATGVKYQFTIYKQVLPDASTGYWKPGTSAGNGVSLGKGQGARFSIDLFHNTAVDTPGDFSFVLSVSAFDA